LILKPKENRIIIMTRETKDKLIKLKFDIFEWFNRAIPIAIVAMLAWVLLTVIGTQKEIVIIQADIVSTRLKITEVENHLAEHRLLVEKQAEDNARTHHSKFISNMTCDSCHVKSNKSVITK